MDDEAKSVVIDIPKPKQYVNTSGRLFKEVHVNKILKRCMKKHYRKPTREVSFQKYSFFYDTPLTSKHFKRDELLLLLHEHTNTQRRDKVKQKLSLKYQERYKIIQTVLENRLHVEYPQDDVNALTDTDEAFYKSVNGRPISDRIPVFKSLKHFLADLLRLKAEIGIRNDAILQIETGHRKELEVYYISLKRFMAQAKYFDNFISEDYEKSRTFLEKWDNLKSKLNIKLAELQNIAVEEFNITSRLMSLDYLYNKQQKYGRFLYYLSPPTWRLNNRQFAHSIEIEATGFDVSLGSEEEETIVFVFNKLKKASKDFVRPVLYFEHPHTLIDIFEGDEKQQLHNFIYVNHLSPQKKTIKESLVSLKDKIKQETALVENFIKMFQTLLDFSENRCTQLNNKFFKILYGLLYESVGSPEILKLFVHLEFAYERFCTEKPINMDLVTMARYLENFYMDYSKRLEALHSNTIKVAVDKCIEKERNKMSKARRAARELHLFEVLKRQLIRAYEPVVPNKRTLVKNPKPKLRKALKTDTYQKTDAKSSLTESEIEYLLLFTDWTEHEDPSKYFHVNERP